MTTIEHRLVTFQSIYVSDRHEWVTLYWREATGRVIINSSYGDWSFSWAHRGNRTLADFLADLDMDYMGGKMLGADYYVFSLDETKVAIKEHILEERRQAALTKEEAEEVWERFNSLKDGDITFEMWVNEESILCDTFDFHRTEPEPSWVHFWNKLWKPFVIPELKKVVNKEVTCTEK